MLPCPFHQLTGLDCPLCGTQRAFVCFFKGQFLEGLAYNYALIIIIPVLVLSILVELFNKNHRFDGIKRIIYHKWAKWSYVILFFVWWVVRNIV